MTGTKDKAKRPSGKSKIVGITFPTSGIISSRKKPTNRATVLIDDLRTVVNPDATHGNIKTLADFTLKLEPYGHNLL